MSRDSVSRIGLGSIGIATAAWHWLPLTDLAQLIGMAIVALPFVLLIVLYRQFWSSFLVGLVLLGVLWGSLIYIRMTESSTAGLIFLLTLPGSYALVGMGLLMDRHKDSHSTMRKRPWQ